MADELSQRMRRNATKTEQLMWSILKQLRGWHFRRQAPIGPYYADIACLQANLVIEVDGESHNLTFQGDADRDEYMRSRGINVVRVTNEDVLRNPDGVYWHIAGVLDAVRATSNTPTPTPSPQGGGEDSRMHRNRSRIQRALPAGSEVSQCP